MDLSSTLKLADSAVIEKNGRYFMSLNEKNGIRMGGEVIAETLTGKPLFHDHNDIIITGSTYFLEKAYGIRSGFPMSTLSADMDIAASYTPDSSNTQQEIIFGFMVGVGGAGNIRGDIRAVKYTDKKLDEVVPFRAPTTQLTGATKDKYFMRKEVGGRHYYYAKKFDSNPTINHYFIDGSEVPGNVDTVGATKGIRVYSEMICVVSSDDLREYFNAIDGNIERCRVNSLGLVAGFPVESNSEYAGVRLVTKINFSNLDLRDLESGLKFTYKNYCV